MDDVLAGAVAGLLATAPMTATMLLLRRVVPPRRRPSLPPPKITERIAERLGVRDELGEEGLRAATAIAHVAYGAAAGALYAPLTKRLAAAPVATGVGFGLAVWAGGYLGWLPALDVMPSATDQPAPRNAVMIVAHLVWGACAGLLVVRLRSGRSKAGA